MDETVKMPDLSSAGSKEVAEAIVKILAERKSSDIRLLHVEDQTVLTDYLIICTGNSSTQVRSLAGEVEYKMGLAGRKCRNIDGAPGSDWIVLDFGCVMVHVFFKETREFYKLEKLWESSTEIDITGLLKEN